jgi:hypothetical protein
VRDSFCYSQPLLPATPHTVLTRHLVVVSGVLAISAFAVHLSLVVVSLVLAREASVRSFAGGVAAVEGAAFFVDAAVVAVEFVDSSEGFVAVFEVTVDWFLGV